MPGLPYQQLPATVTPEMAFERQVKQEQQRVQNKFNQEWEAFNKQISSGVQRISQNEYTVLTNKLHEKYKSIAADHMQKINAQRAEFKQINRLVNTGQINPQAGQQAMWRMTLPAETQKAMFPGREKITPFSPGQLAQKAFIKSIDDFAHAAPEEPGIEWGPPKRTRENLIKQYKSWQDYVGYEFLNPSRQNQIDMVWDAFMRDKAGYMDWDPNDPKIKATRATGRLQKSMAKRFDGTPTGAERGITPLSTAITKERNLITRNLPTGSEMREWYGKKEPKKKAKRAVNPTTGQRIISYDDGKSWQTIE